jgi:NADH-quinone oxidoreductase subunit N
MTAHDVYVISPYLGVAGVAILVILVDLVAPRKGVLPALAFLGLLAPLSLSLVQAFDLGDSLNLVRGADPLAAGEASALLGSLSLDRFALFFNFLVLAASGAVVLASTEYVRKMERYQGEYYALLLFSATGMMLLAAATELITIYIALELTTLPLAALAAFLMSPRSSEAGMKFFIVSAISSAIMLFGMALVFGFAGSTGLADIAASFQTPAQVEGLPFGSYAMLVGVVLMVAGFGFKISSVPFQMWVPDVYEGAPTPVVAFLSVASKAAAFAVLLRVFYTGFFDAGLDWGGLMAGLAAASMIIGNLVAIGQSNIRRLFGYSTIAHAGYILVGVAAGVKSAGPDSSFPEFVSTGPDSVLFYLGAYTAANLTAFFAIVAISNRTGSDRIEDYAGMVRRAPVLAALLALALVALIGVPPTGIFIAKLYVFTAAVKAGLTWLAILGVISSVVSAYYYVRIIRVMFLQPPSSEERITVAPAAWLALGIAGSATLWLGVAPGHLLELSRIAAGSLTP